MELVVDLLIEIHKGFSNVFSQSFLMRSVHSVFILASGLLLIHAETDCQILKNWLGLPWLQAHAPTEYTFCQTTPNENFSQMYVQNLIFKSLERCSCQYAIAKHLVGLII